MVEPGVWMSQTDFLNYLVHYCAGRQTTDPTVPEPVKYKTSNVLAQCLLPPGTIVVHSSEENRLQEDVAKGEVAWTYNHAEISQCMVPTKIAHLDSNKGKSSGSTEPPKVYGALLNGTLYTSLARLEVALKGGGTASNNEPHHLYLRIDTDPLGPSVRFCDFAAALEADMESWSARVEATKMIKELGNKKTTAILKAVRRMSSSKTPSAAPAGLKEAFEMDDEPLDVKRVCLKGPHDPHRGKKRISRPAAKQANSPSKLANKNNDETVTEGCPAKRSRSSSPVKSPAAKPHSAKKQQQQLASQDSSSDGMSSWPDSNKQGDYDDSVALSEIESEPLDVVNSDDDGVPLDIVDSDDDGAPLDVISSDEDE